MADTYRIYLVNNSASKQVFWLFLQPPKELVSDPNVFANSSASLAVRPNASGLNYFTVPVQYSVGAGSSNNAVGLGVQVTSTVQQNTNLGKKWLATYYTVPPQEGPELVPTSGTVPATAVGVATNAFDKIKNENNKWFSSQSFGIETPAGYIGLTWSPEPNQTRTLTPTLAFYVAVGSYGANELASWTQVSTDSAIITVPNNFLYGDATVTYTQTGEWVVTPGKPPALVAAAALFGLPNRSLANLAAAALLSDQGTNHDTQNDIVTSVSWGNAEEAIADNLITGTLSVQTALIASFTFFILSGVHFNITSDPRGGTRVRFSYNGAESREALQKILKAGANLLFSGADGNG